MAVAHIPESHQVGQHLLEQIRHLSVHLGWLRSVSCAGIGSAALAGRGVKSLVRRGIRALGLDLVQYPILDDLALRQHLQRLLPLLEINTVLDVGAHRGEFGQFLRDMGYTGHIFSFEPVRENFERLEKLCAKDGRWQAVCCALGDHEGVETLHVARHSSFSSFLPVNDFGRRQFASESATEKDELVPMKRLDDVFEECVRGIENPRVYLKIDTQGYDLRVLEGAAGHVDRVLALQLELSVKSIYEGPLNYLEAIAQANQKGFEVTGLFPVSCDSAMRVIEFDCVFVGPNSLYSFRMMGDTRKRLFYASFASPERRVR